MSIANDLKIKAGEAKEPGLVPNGRWELRCSGGKLEVNEEYDPEEPNSARYKGYIAFLPVKPLANFEKSEVADGTWRGKSIFKRFWVRSQDDLYEADKVLGALGFDLDGSREYEDLFATSKNRTMTADVGISVRKRNGQTFKENTLSDYAAVN